MNFTPHIIKMLIYNNTSAQWNIFPKTENFLLFLFYFILFFFLGKVEEHNKNVIVLSCDWCFNCNLASITHFWFDFNIPKLWYSFPKIVDTFQGIISSFNSLWSANLYKKEWTNQPTMSQIIIIFISSRNWPLFSSTWFRNALPRRCRARHASRLVCFEHYLQRTAEKSKSNKLRKGLKLKGLKAQRRVRFCVLLQFSEGWGLQFWEPFQWQPLMACKWWEFLVIPHQYWAEENDQWCQRFLSQMGLGWIQETQAHLHQLKQSSYWLDSEFQSR